MHTDTAPADRPLDIRVEASDAYLQIQTPARNTPEEAAADLARLPRGARLRATSCRHWHEDAPMTHTYYATAYIDYAPNGVNGGKNETGAKRFRSLMRWADKNAVPVVYAPAGPTCGPATLAELDARL